MRSGFAQESIVELAPGGDPAALGAAITVALCGHWEHEPPCPLAPHNTEATASGERVRLRTVFVTESANEEEVRRRIVAALAAGRIVEPTAVRWRLVRSEPAELAREDRALARRLAA